MFHNDDTLNLLEKYRKTKYNEKENRQFYKNQKLPKLSLIPIILFIGYFLIVNLSMSKNTNKISKINQLKKEEKYQIEKEIVDIPPQPTQYTQPIIERKIEIAPSQTTTPQPQTITRAEPPKQTTTIEVVPQQSQPKQEPMKKIEVEEEIRPSSSTSVGYYR